MGRVRDRRAHSNALQFVHSGKRRHGQVARAIERYHGVLDHAACKQICHHSLQTAPDFDTNLAFCRCDEDEEAAARDTPFVERVERHFLYRLAVEGGVGNHHQRNTGFIEVVGQVAFEGCLLLGTKNVGFIQHRPVRALRYIARLGWRRTGSQQQGEQCGETGRHGPADQLSVPVAASSAAELSLAGAAAPLPPDRPLKSTSGASSAPASAWKPCIGSAP